MKKLSNKNLLYLLGGVAVIGIISLAVVTNQGAGFKGALTYSSTPMPSSSTTRTITSGVTSNLTNTGTLATLSYVKDDPTVTAEINNTIPVLSKMCGYVDSALPIYAEIRNAYLGGNAANYSYDLSRLTCSFPTGSTTYATLAKASRDICNRAASEAVLHSNLKTSSGWNIGYGYSITTSNCDSKFASQTTVAGQLAHVKAVRDTFNASLNDTGHNIVSMIQQLYRPGCATSNRLTANINSLVINYMSTYNLWTCW
jgi:hypothetical protein